MKTLQESKKVLVLTSSKLNVDKIAAAFAIASNLKSDMGKEVQIFSSNKLTEAMLKIFAVTSDIKVINSLPPKKYVLEFMNQKNKVKNIQWNQEGSNVSVFVSMENGDFNHSNMNLKIVGADFESVILVGIESYDEISALVSANKELFKDATVVSVGGKVQSSEFTITQEVDEKSSSVSEDAYTFITKNGGKVNQLSSTAILAGIFTATNNFKKNVKDPKTFMVSAELMKVGATNEAANKIIENGKSLQAQQPSQTGSQPSQQGSQPTTSSQSQSGQSQSTSSNSSSPQGSNQMSTATNQSSSEVKN